VLVRLWKPKGEIIMVRRFVPAKTKGGVGYLKPVGRPTAAQELEHFRQMGGVVAFTSVDSRSGRTKRREPQQPPKQEEE
jgi:hypothetical protein